MNRQGDKLLEESYLGEDAAEVFTKLLLKKEYELMTYIERYFELQMTDADQELFDKTLNCGDCGACFSQDVKKVR